MWTVVEALLLCDPQQLCICISAVSMHFIVQFVFCTFFAIVPNFRSDLHDFQYDDLPKSKLALKP